MERKYFYSNSFSKDSIFKHQFLGVIFADYGSIELSNKDFTIKQIFDTYVAYTICDVFKI